MLFSFVAGMANPSPSPQILYTAFCRFIQLLVAHFATHPPALQGGFFIGVIPVNITELKNVEGFAAFCEGLNLRHFSPRELLSKGQAHETPGHRGYGLNTDPPPERWPNVIPAITMADRMREHFGRPVVILSAYRSAAYNAAIGGASRSQHLKFTALDLSCPGITPQACFDWLCIQRERDVFRGGLGLYRSFIHVDGRGTNATWNNT